MAKKVYTKELGRKVSSDAKRVDAKRFHVIFGDEDRWLIVSEGRTRPFKVFSTQRQAVTFAKRNASQHIGEVIVHKKTGQVRDTFSYKII